MVPQVLGEGESLRQRGGAVLPGDLSPALSVPTVSGFDSSSDFICFWKQMLGFGLVNPGYLDVLGFLCAGVTVTLVSVLGFHCSSLTSQGCESWYGLLFGIAAALI